MDYAQTEQTQQEREFISRMLGRVAGKKLTSALPVMSGSSYFYEVASGWETAVFQGCDNVRLVTTVQDLEDAFIDVEVRTIFIPRRASVTRNIAMRVCKRHGQGKSVFFEVDNNE